MNDKPLVMVSLVSRQVWPHILALVHAPASITRLVLLHSGDREESAAPAERLKDFAARTGARPISQVDLHYVPHDDFRGVERVLDGLQLDVARAVLNFTGGNKLMATAAFRWAMRRGVPAFYIERGNLLVRFEPREGDVVTTVDPINAHATDAIDPVDILKCQIGAATVSNDGEKLELSPAGRKTHIGQIMEMIQSERQAYRADDFRRFVQGWRGSSTRARQEGANLEYAAAVVLLKSGVPCVRCGIELVSRRGTRTEGELDLVFNWGARLWVVDCKDRSSDAQKVENLRTAFLRQGPIRPSISRQLDRLRDLLEERQIKILREGLQQAYESAGIMAQVVCVRSAALPAQATDYARSRGVRVIHKNNMGREFRDMLGLGRPASREEIVSLREVFAK